MSPPGSGGLIQTASGNGWGLGRPRTKRSGWSSYANNEMRQKLRDDVDAWQERLDLVVHIPAQSWSGEIGEKKSVRIFRSLIPIEFDPQANFDLLIAAIRYRLRRIERKLGERAGIFQDWVPRYNQKLWTGNMKKAAYPSV